MIRRAAAKEWTLWEMGTSKLFPDPAYIQKADNLDFAAAFARIECHYFVNAIFLEEAFILNNADKIKDIPVDIVQVSRSMMFIASKKSPTPRKAASEMKKASLLQQAILSFRAVTMLFVQPNLLGSYTKPCHKASWRLSLTLVTAWEK